MNATMAKKPNKPDPAKLLSTAPAAEYLGITPRTLHYHVEVGNISPSGKVTVGNERELKLFTVASLDELREKIRPGGRPGKGRPRNTDEQ